MKEVVLYWFDRIMNPKIPSFGIHSHTHTHSHTYNIILLFSLWSLRVVTVVME